MLPKIRSSSWTSESGLPYNIVRGLRSIYYGSAFLPAFVIDGLYGKKYKLNFIINFFFKIFFNNYYCFFKLFFFNILIVFNKKFNL